MKEFIEKLIGRLEEEMAGHLNLYCDGLIKAMSVAKELAEEYKDINIITNFLQYVRDNADNYDADNGWSLSDLIDLSIKFCDEEEHKGGCEWEIADAEMDLYYTECGNAYIFAYGNLEENNYKFCPYCGKKIKVVE